MKPNILLLLPDGLQGRAADPQHPAITPNLDRMCREGTRVTGAYTPLATCSPARASIMTGLLPHNHGVLQVEHCVDDDQSVLRDVPHFAQRLTNAGYHTAFYGKWHVERSNELEQFGWQESVCSPAGSYRNVSRNVKELPPEPLDPELTRYHKGPDGYKDVLHYGVTDTAVADRSVSVPATDACAFLERVADDDTPWCCCVSFSQPNEAMICSRETFDQYDVDALPLPPNLMDDMSERPGIYGRQQDIWRGVSDDEWRMAAACYYSRITEVDVQLGRLIDQLERSGELDNTIILFSADHGKYVGAHGMEAHNFGAFEEIYNIPMLARGPGIAADAVNDARVGFHEIGQTILELAGAECIDTPDSRSFAAALRDPAEAAAFTSGYAEYHGTRFPLMQRILWHENWKFVFNGFDYDELYDLENDPYELQNLARKPEHAERCQQLMGLVWRRVHDTGDRALLETHYYSMRFAAVGPNVALE